MVKTRTFCGLYAKDCELWLLSVFAVVVSVWANVLQCPKPAMFDTTTSTCQVPQDRNYTLPWLHPGQVNQVSKIRLATGEMYKRVTLSRDPPVFEIHDFLSDEECRQIISQAQLKGLRGARQMGPDKARQSNQATGRVSETTFVSGGGYLHSVRQRVAMVTRMPLDLVMESEPIQVVMYKKGGHYHSHFDSYWEDVPDADRFKPCCHQTWFPHTKQRCVMCRYMTVLFYLNDVINGGETVFPMADGRDHNFRITKVHTNLSENCHRARLKVKPKKGKAVVWYNHYRDDKTGWIGPLNRLSLHGGCDVKTGEKWIANLWINAGRYEDKNKYSIYFEKWK